ncbi:MAG: ornithine carbamoyltransferase [Candidatus Margulisbacteria bacterium GWF2_35_9]|nr:MAG: ornithine carbamoyltransferase [Candidatus Margulisbacteria bacterium GWF2_35_9]
MKRDFLSILDLNYDEINEILNIAMKLKEDSPLNSKKVLNGKSFAMIFEKPSTRTYISFDVAIHQLGGHIVTLNENSLSGREELSDIAKCLSRYVDGIIIRTFQQKTLNIFADNSSVPVINALTDKFHPCQIMSDYLTIVEKKGRGKIKITYLGDGYNVAHSLLLLASKVGYDICFGTPKGFEPDKKILKKASEFAKISGSTITLANNPQKAIANADIVYTDTWTSMGLEHEAEKRIKLFSKFQVNDTLLAQASSDALVMHCLPAHRGQEITDEVMDGPQSIVFDQAENRLHMQKAILAFLYQ